MRKLITILLLLFAGAVSAQVTPITYTPMNNAGYNFKYLKADSGFHVPFLDTTISRGAVRPGAIVCFTGDTLLYVWNGLRWRKVGGTGGLDSVTVSGITICQHEGVVATCYVLDTTLLATRYYVTNNINNSITQNNFNTFGVDSTTRLITGSFVIDSGLVGHNTDLYYKILGRFYDAAYSVITIDPSLGSDRKVSIVADTLGNVYPKYGTYSNPASDPTIDAESECLIVTYTVRAVVDTIVGVSNIWVYRDGINYWANSRGTISTAYDSAYVTLPYSDPNSLRISSQVAGQYYEWTDGSSHNATDYTILDFFIRLNATFSKSTKWGFTFWMDSSLVTSNTVVLQDAQFGYSRTVSGSYQPVAIPLNQFNFIPPFLFNKIRVTNIGNGLTPYQIDDVKLQAGGGNVGGGGNITVNNVPGPNVLLKIGNILRLNADSSLYELVDSLSGVTLRVVPTFLKYLVSQDTCLVLDSIDAKHVGISGNPYCRGIKSVVAGTNITVDNTDPLNPIINSTASGTGGISTLGSPTYGLTKVNDSTYRVDSTEIGNKDYIDALAALKKDKADSILSTGYATQYDLTKTKDSLQTNINLKLNISDTAAMLDPYKNNYPRQAVSLVFTTTGSSGAATGTYNNGTGVFTFNVPQYSGGGSGMAIGGTVTSGKAKAVFFGGVGGTLQQDSARYSYDSANAIVKETRLNVGGLSPLLNANYKPTEVAADTLRNGLYNQCGIMDVLPNGWYVQTYRQATDHLAVNGTTLLKLKISKDKGRTWSAGTTIQTDPTYIMNEAYGMVTPSGRILVFYTRFDALGVNQDPIDISYFYSDDYGTTWSTPQTLNTTIEAANVYEVYDHTIAIDSGQLMQGWYGLTLAGGAGRCYITKSNDDGATWGSPILSLSGSKYYEPSYAYLGGGYIVGLARNDAGRYFRQFISANNGNTWTDIGDATFDPVRLHPPTLSTFISSTGKRVVECYYHDSTLNDFKVISAYAIDLINNGVSAWNYNSKVVIAAGNGGRYASVVHPYERPYGYGWYYTDSAVGLQGSYNRMNYFVAPASPLNTTGLADTIINWSRLGNVTTSADYLGTKNNDSIRVRTNNIQRLTIAGGTGNADFTGNVISPEFSAKSATRTLITSSNWSIGIPGIGTTTNNSMYLGSNGLPRWKVDSTGHFFAHTDNTWDIGASGGTRPRTGYFGTSLFSLAINGGTNANEDVTINGTSSATKTTSYVILQPTGGLVGIGTSSPVATFNVNSSTNVTSWLTAGTSNGNYAHMVLGEGTTGGSGVAAEIFRYSNASTAASLPGSLVIANLTKKIYLSTTHSGSYLPDLVVDASKVGIGHASPTSLLHIKSGTTGASSAPLKLALLAPALNTTAEKYAVEVDSTTGGGNIYYTNASATRYTIAKTLANTATLDFGSTLAGAVTDLTITVTGAADGDAVTIGVPNGSYPATGTFTAWVSSANTVTIRYANNSLTLSQDPASGTFRASVIKY